MAIQQTKLVNTAAKERNGQHINDGSFLFITSINNCDSQPTCSERTVNQRNPL